MIINWNITIKNQHEELNQNKISRRYHESRVVVLCIFFFKLYGYYTASEERI